MPTRSSALTSSACTPLAHSHVVEVKGASHSVYESRPKEVAALIEQAAQHAQDGSPK
jgi:hypothetical protein